MGMRPQVESFFDDKTFTVSHVAADSATGGCVIIDSVLDYDLASGRTGTQTADNIVDHVKKNNLTVEWILETHVHADHLSAAPYLKETLGGRIATGDNVSVIQKTFGELFNAEREFAYDGSQFDTLLADNATFTVGDIEAHIMHTPGHTPSCVTIVIGDAAFVGDTLFMPDYGTARCDFPGGDARLLYRSIQKIFALPDETRLFMCHDYKAPGRNHFAWETTVAEQKTSNIHIGGGISEDDFVAMRESRDATLNMPRLLLPSVQVNMRAGAFPPPEANGVRYLKLPVDAL